MILALDDEVPDAVAEAIRASEGVARPLVDPAGRRTLSDDGGLTVPAELVGGRRPAPPRRVDVHRRGPLPGPPRTPRCRALGRAPGGAGRGAPRRSRPVPRPADPTRRAARDRPLAARAARAATAEAVRAAIALAAVTAPDAPRPGLLEIGQGVWEGPIGRRSSREHGELLAAWRRTPLTGNAPDGERVLDAAERVRTASKRVVARLASSRHASIRGGPSAAGRRLPAQPCRRARGRSSSPTTGSSRSCS